MRRATHARGHRPAGFTLFEVVLAIALSAVLMGLLGTALHVYIRGVSVGRGDVEQAQLARAILSQIAEDLRATIRQIKQEGSSQSGSSGGEGIDSGDGGSIGDPLDPIDSVDSGTQAEIGNISTGASAMTMPGLYGNQNQLQVDVSRVPRFDELDALMQVDGTVPAGHASDIRTIAYYVQQGQEVEESSAAATGLGAADQTLRSGLIRRETDRATALYAAQYGGSLTLQGQEKLLAPEVTWIQFQYFDGTQLWTEWDSTVNGGPPLAVEVRIWLRPPRPDDGQEESAPDRMSSSTGPDPSDEMYRMVVHLPAAEATSLSGTSSATGATGSGMGTTGTGTATGAGTR